MSDITLGIIGSGQLGSLLCKAAKKLNIKTVVISDDEKGQMLGNPDDQHHMHGHDGMDASNVPLQSKHEEEM